MSDNWLKFVPRDPRFRPLADDAERARRLLVSFAPYAQEVTAIFTDAIQFVDCGGNLECVRCPACGQDIMSWWGDAMTAAYSTGFEHLDVITPCCRANTSLDRLRYDWPAAFGRFVLEAMNPNVKDLLPGQLEAMSEAVGSPLQRIWVHL